MGNCACERPEREYELDTRGFFSTHSTRATMLSDTLSKSPHPELITKLQKTFPENTSITEIPYYQFNQLLSAYTELQPTLQEIASYYDNETPIPTLNESSSLIKINPLHICNTKTDEEQYIDCYLNSQGEITGIGTILTQNGNFYKGEFKNNVFNGLGFFINGNGDFYYGTWENGESCGKGDLRMRNGAHYSGEFKHNQKNGHGEETYEDGSYYVGDFVNNVKEGKGRIEFNDGSIYTGEFKGGKMHGKGLYQWNDGRFYNGEFEDGKIQGKGKFKYQDGSVYNGYYVDNKKNGNGVYSWIDGKKYVGFWKEDSPEGEGSYDIGGKKYEVMYKDGKVVEGDINNDNSNNNNIN